MYIMREVKAFFLVVRSYSIGCTDINILRQPFSPVGQPLPPSLLLPTMSVRAQFLLLSSLLVMVPTTWLAAVSTFWLCLAAIKPLTTTL